MRGAGGGPPAGHRRCPLPLQPAARCWVPLAAQVESAGAADELLSRAQRQEHCRRDEDLMRARVRQLRAARAAGPREA